LALAKKRALVWRSRFMGAPSKKEVTSIDLVLRQMGGHKISEDIEIPGFPVASRS
jgi:hypothetical protein